MNAAAGSLPGKWLDVGDDHQVYYEIVGSGIPVVFLHGGPGSGFRSAHTDVFDRRRYRTLFFDQRGAGRSRPARELKGNTTAHLLADMEKLREAAGVERWIVVGGSWGATLALAYAEQHPDRVAGMVLRAVFLGTRAELDRAFLGVARTLRPELTEQFLSLLTPGERADPLPAYWRRILDPDPDLHVPAAWAWHDTERILSEAKPAATTIAFKERAGALPSTPFFEAHYFSHDCFLQPDQLMKAASRLAGIPGVIVQGRYDLLCPPSGSAALAAAWPDATVATIEGAGHAMSEPGIEEAMIRGLDQVAEKAVL